MRGRRGRVAGPGRGRVRVASGTPGAPDRRARTRAGSGSGGPCRSGSPAHRGGPARPLLSIRGTPPSGRVPSVPTSGPGPSVPHPACPWRVCPALPSPPPGTLVYRTSLASDSLGTPPARRLRTPSASRPAPAGRCTLRSSLRLTLHCASPRPRRCHPPADFSRPHGVERGGCGLLARTCGRGGGAWCAEPGFGVWLGWRRGEVTRVWRGEAGSASFLSWWPGHAS